MALKHFSHEHSLELRAEVTFEEIEEENQKLPSYTCYMCRKLISSWAYFCDQCDWICLHKTCAELPEEILHPMHSAHPLKCTLLAQSHCPCYACWQDFSGSSYSCGKCNLYICIGCALKVYQELKFHHHPLTLVRTEVSSKCCACDLPMSSSTPSYMCNTCSFWVHEKCASLPNIIECGTHDNDHDHPLTLAYQLPIELHRYNFECESCKGKLMPSEWIYYCRRCKYFVHARCLGRPTRGTNIIDYNHRDGRAGPDDVCLPCDDMFIDVIKPLVEKMVQAEIKLLLEIQHFSHEHPLVLSSTPLMENDKDTDQEMLCHGCVLPISTPYYTCVKCNYVLHFICANIPEKVFHVICANVSKEVHHLGLYGHLVTLKKFKNELGYFCCSQCGTIGNGFFFSCEKCHLQYHLKCVVILSRPVVFYKLNNEEHNLRSPTRLDSWRCLACRDKIARSVACYECIDCGISLHKTCATLPPAVKHRWDKHPLLLTYPPFSDHPDEFYCEICENEIHPKTWIYHCRECDQSFHPKCIPRLVNDKDMIFGSSIQFANHEHALTSVREVRYRSSCSGCHKKLEGKMAWECEICRFCFPFSLCFACACHAKDPNYLLPESHI